MNSKKNLDKQCIVTPNIFIKQTGGLNNYANRKVHE